MITIANQMPLGYLFAFYRDFRSTFQENGEGRAPKHSIYFFRSEIALRRSINLENRAGLLAGVRKPQNDVHPSQVRQLQFTHMLSITTSPARAT